MMLVKGWFKRRAGVAPAPGEAVVDLFATELEGETEYGTYYVQRAGDDWCVHFRAAGARLDQRDLAIDARDERGPRDWPTRGCAAEAVNLHARLMQLGYGAVRAAELVAQRSQRVTGASERSPTLDYAQPIAVQR